MSPIFGPAIEERWVLKVDRLMRFETGVFLLHVHCRLNEHNTTRFPKESQMTWVYFHMSELLYERMLCDNFIIAGI